jgi:hypothetical protein
VRVAVNKRKQTIWIVGILVVLVCLSGVAYLWVAAGSFSVCTPQESQDTYAKTIAALDGIVDLGLKLSTSLVGLGAAVLIGWKAGLKLTFPIKIIILVATLLLIQSALYAVWWRFGVAELWLNDCLELVAQPRLGRRYEAHYYFFLAGLISLGVLVISALFSEKADREGT